ncbi:MAG: cytochrome P450 [Proteobacteria bacterium]|nr:cytochrome P450 [Pseudomonadota bacterium]
MNPKSHKLHQLRHRRDAFASLDPKVWWEDGIIKATVVAEPQVVVDVLRRPDSSLPDWNYFVGGAERVLGRRLEHLREASEFMPVLMHNEAHAKARKSLAIYLANRLQALEPGLPSIAGDAAARMLAGSTVDLFAEVVRPVVLKVGSVLIDADMPPDFLDRELSGVFPGSKSPSEFARINDDFGHVFAFLKPRCGSSEELANKLCCLTFGIDSLTMLLIESIITAIDEAGEARAIKLPDYPVETGVPVTSRYVKSDFEIDGGKFPAGTSVRLQMQSLGYSNENVHQQAIFGAGAHVCVGKQITLRLWTQFAKAINELELKGRIVSYELRKSMYVCLYKSVKVELWR